MAARHGDNCLAVLKYPERRKEGVGGGSEVCWGEVCGGTGQGKHMEMSVGNFCTP